VEGQRDSDEEFSFYRYVGEYLREASVLILVFGFLDPLVPQGDRLNTLRERIAAIPALWAILVLAVSLTLVALGILLEWLRKR
jgi:hypothetical protein